MQLPYTIHSRGFPDGTVVKKNPPVGARDAKDMGSIPGSGRVLGEGNGNPLQNSCLENPMDRGVWWAMVHGVTESDTPEHSTQVIYSRGTM